MHERTCSELVREEAIIAPFNILTVSYIFCSAVCFPNQRQKSRVRLVLITAFMHMLATEV